MKNEKHPFFYACISPNIMGFPDNWKESVFWKDLDVSGDEI
ncbi:MAG: hypothetical protein ABH869_07830 [Candidatus Omnitrophota bacterium]